MLRGTSNEKQRKEQRGYPTEKQNKSTKNTKPTKTASYLRCLKGKARVKEQKG